MRLLPLALLGCAPEPADTLEAESENGLFTVTAEIDEDPVVGDVSVAMHFSVPCDGVDVEPWMPSMGHGGHASCDPHGDDWVATVGCSMAGYWELHVTCHLGDESDTAVLGWDVR